jgi:magnesium transporter
MLKAYVRQADRLLPVDVDLSAETESAGAAVWYDLVAPTSAEDKFVEACLGIEIPTRDEMKDIEPSARLYNENGAEFMTITALVNTDTDEPLKTQVTFVLRNNQLVTLRYADPKAFGIVAKACARPNGRISGEKVMASLLDAFIDRLAQLLERTGDEIDQVSHDVFRNKTRNVTRKARDLQSMIERIGKKGELQLKHAELQREFVLGERAGHPRQRERRGKSRYK